MTPIAEPEEAEFDELMDALSLRDRNKILRKLQGEGHYKDKKPTREKPPPTPDYVKRAQDEVKRSQQELGTYDNITSQRCEPALPESAPERRTAATKGSAQPGCGTLLWTLAATVCGLLLLSSPVWPLSIVVFVVGATPLVTRVVSALDKRP